MLLTLKQTYPHLQVCPTSSPRHAEQLAATAITSGADLILVAGGDGTLNEVANGMIGSHVPLAILPAGTANVLACEVNLPRDPVRAALAIPHLTPRRIGVGRLTVASGESRHFLLMTGAGLDAAVLERVSQSLKNRTGKFAYYVAGFSMVGQRLPQLEVEADGFKLQTLFALTSRVRNYGGDLTIAAGASLLSSEFQLVTFEGSTTWRYPVYLTGALFGKVGHFPGVHMIRAKRIRFAPLNGSPVLAQLDGEPAGALPAVAEMVPDALTLLLPATYGNAAQ